MTDNVLSVNAENATLNTAFLVNVGLAYASYASMFGLAALMPFQVSVLPRSLGAPWLYVLVLFGTIFEYFKWPVQIISFLFKTDDIKVGVLTHEEKLAAWEAKAQLWWPIFTGLSALSLLLALTLGSSLTQYWSQPLFYFVMFGIFAGQNYAF